MTIAVDMGRKATKTTTTTCGMDSNQIVQALRVILFCMQTVEAIYIVGASYCFILIFLSYMCFLKDIYFVISGIIS